MLKNKYFWLFLICVIGTTLRFYKLGNYPVGFHSDEAFLGYNAYSLLKTGKDITGDFLPVHFKSFLYSPGGYSYFSIIPILIFGLSAFSSRFSSAFFGSLTLLLVFSTTYYLFEKKHENKHFKKDTFSIPLISALLLAINPWHINLSRTATENVIVLFLIMLGFFLYFIWYPKLKSVKLLICYLCFFVSLFIYQAPRFFLPFFILLLTFFFKKAPNVKTNIFLYSILIVLPVIFIIVTPSLSQRIKMLSLISNPGVSAVIDEQQSEDGLFHNSLIIARIFHNKIINYSLVFLKNYFSHYSFNFLFLDQILPSRYRVPGYGLFHLFEFPFIATGLFFLLKDKQRTGLFLLGWLIISPLGSSFSFDDVPNMQRTLFSVPPLIFFSAYGISKIFFYLKTTQIKLFFISTLSFTALFSLLFYLHQYYVHQTLNKPWYRQESYKELVEQVNNLLPEFKKAVVTTSNSTPSIFFLFYSKYNPANFQKEFLKSRNENFGQISFAKYKFVDDDCPLKMKNGKKMIKTISGEKDVLYVNKETCLVDPKFMTVLSEVKRLDGSIVFRILSAAAH